MSKAKKLKDILDMTDYLQHRCYCPGEIYSSDGFFYQIFEPDAEYKEIGKCDFNDNYLCKIPFIAVISKSVDDITQILLIGYTDEKIVDIIRFDATENNIRLLKEVIKNNKTELKFNEYEKGKTTESLEKILNIADAIIID